MAEAIALGAGIIAVIQISDRIIGLTKHYIETVHDAPRDLHVIRIEASALKATFESLEFLQESEYALSKNLQKLGEKDGAVEGCRRSVSELEQLLDSNPQSSNGGKRRKIQATLSSLAWPFKENRAKKLLEEIMRYKTTITLSLSIEHVYVKMINHSFQAVCFCSKFPISDETGASITGMMSRHYAITKSHPNSKLFLTGSRQSILQLSRTIFLPVGKQEPANGF
jgi:hypothetical protein